MKRFSLSKIKGSQELAKNPYEGLLLQYKDLLRHYKQTLEKHIQELPLVDNYASEGQLYISQLSQLREQSEKMILLLEELKQRDEDAMYELDKTIIDNGKQILDQMESLLATIIETNYKLEELDKSLLNKMTANFEELQKQFLHQIKENQALLHENQLMLHRKVKGNRIFLWIIFIFQIIGMGGLAFIILYLLDYIWF